MVRNVCIFAFLLFGALSTPLHAIEIQWGADKDRTLAWGQTGGGMQASSHPELTMLQWHATATVAFGKNVLHAELLSAGQFFDNHSSGSGGLLYGRNWQVTVRNSREGFAWGKFISTVAAGLSINTFERRTDCFWAAKPCTERVVHSEAAPGIPLRAGLVYVPLVALPYIGVEASGGGNVNPYRSWMNVQVGLVAGLLD